MVLLENYLCISTQGAKDTSLWRMYAGKELFHVHTYLVVRLVGTEDEIGKKWKISAKYWENNRLSIYTVKRMQGIEKKPIGIRDMMWAKFE